MELWRLSEIDESTLDFRPLNDDIGHEPGPDCVCGPERLEATETEPEAVYRHNMLRGTNG